MVSTSLDDVVLEDAHDSHRLPDLCRSGPLVAIVLRHFGCPVCREHLLTAGEIQSDVQARGGRLIAVAQGTGEEAAAYAEALDVGYPVYGDPRKRLYRTLGIPRGSWWQVTVGPLVRRPIAGLRRLRHVSTPGPDVRQLGGVAVIDAGGRLLWCYRQTDSGDVPPNERILEALQAARQ